MFQHIWFNKKSFNGIVNIKGTKPQNWVNDEDIEEVLLTCWCEHCLECAVPLCYHNCENWVERMDKKCQKTYYGTALFEYQGEKVAQLRFRKWGKIEACINANASSYNHYQKLYKNNIRIEKIVKWIAQGVKWISPTMKLCGAQNLYRDKYLRTIKGKGKYDSFLLQCYSPSDLSYNLIVEFYTPQGTFYRNSAHIEKGFNQNIFDIKGLYLHEEENARARIYPENNLTEEIVFFKTDFVRLKKETLPVASSIEPAKHIKCVAWDLDNTLWNGVLIETEPSTLKLREGVKETIRALDEKGIIQIVVSKNDIADVEPQLKRLGIYEMFVYVFANWNSKSDNLKSAAELINININTFALVDDSPYERGEVKENLPCVRVYKETKLSELLSYPEFDVPVTDDGRKRRLMYQTEVKRRKVEQSFNGTNVDFLKSCNLQMTISRITDETLPRCYELVQRTNQLNLSGVKYSLDEFRIMCHKHKENCFVSECHDKYGDYGIVGFFYVETESNSVVFKEYAMSCRVASKWLEPRLIQWMSEFYHKNEVAFKGVDNKKNGLLIRTLQGFGMKNYADDGKLDLRITKEQMNWAEVVSIIYTTNKQIDDERNPS